MQASTAIALAVFVAGTLWAQQPTPSGEVQCTKPTAKHAPAPWAQRDAELLSTLLRHRHSLLNREPSPGWSRGLLGQTWDQGSAWCGVFAADELGAIELPRQLAKGRPFCIAAWPKEVGGEHRVALLLHSDGTAMVCELTGDAVPLSPEVFTARGSQSTFADVLRQPGTSQSEHLWLWLDQMATTASITVVDEQGTPRTGVQVLSGPIGLEFHGQSAARLPMPMPIAFATTDTKGTARLRGPIYPANQLWLQCGDYAVLTGRCRITQEGGSLRVVVPQQALVPTSSLANEAAAIATLKNISSAQCQCKAQGIIDGNGNGAGEYGCFGELSGNVALRKDAKGGIGDTKMSPPVLSAAFRKVKASRVERSGYIFQIFLPTADGSAVSEAETGGAAGVSVDPHRAEVTWCAYAWPISEQTGRRCFFVNQSGDVSATDNESQGYAGSEKPPMPNAAFAKGSSGKLDAPMALNADGCDGGKWVVVQ